MPEEYTPLDDWLDHKKTKSKNNCTDAVAVLISSHWFIHETIQSPQANRSNVLVALLKFTQYLRDSAGGLGCDSYTRLANCTRWFWFTTRSTLKFCIEVNRRYDKVYMRANVLREMIGFASYKEVREYHSRIL